MGILGIIEEGYRQKKFDTILEGCQLSERGEEPQYCGLELLIPKNSCCLVVPGFKFLLYARDFDVSKRVEIPKNIQGGFPVREHFKTHLSYIFECPRAFITRDGRVYITKQAFDYSRDDYIEGLIPRILSDTRRIFQEGLTPEEIKARV